MWWFLCIKLSKSLFGLSKAYLYILNAFLLTFSPIPGIQQIIWSCKTIPLAKNNPNLSQGLDLLSGTRERNKAFSDLISSSSEIVANLILHFSLSYIAKEQFVCTILKSYITRNCKVIVECRHAAWTCGREKALGAC